MKDNNTRLGGSFPTIWPWVLFFCLHYVWAYIFPRLIIICSVLFCSACFSFLYSDCSESTENWSRQSKIKKRTELIIIEIGQSNHAIEQITNRDQMRTNWIECYCTFVRPPDDSSWKNVARSPNPNPMGVRNKVQYQ